MRIVSLLPSGTEIVAALGLASRMVARSHECDYPREIMPLPPCTISSMGISGTPTGAEEVAPPKSQRALSPFRVDWGLLKGLRPTHVITQMVCRQCAVSAEEVRDALAKELHSEVTVVSFEALTLEGLLAEIQVAADQLEASDAGKRLVDGMRKRYDEARQRAEQKKPEDRPLVACLDWLEPVMIAGNWMPEMIRIAGARPAGGGDGVHSGWTQWDELLDLDPDVVIGMPCGYSLPRAVRAFRRTMSHFDWSQLRAVREGRLYLADGSQFFNRPGPRLVDSLEILEEIIGRAKPEQCRHLGKHWMPISLEKLAVAT